MRVARALWFVSLSHVLLTAVPALAQQKPTLTPADYAKWESLGATELAPNGRYVAYVVSRVDEDDELRVHDVLADSTRVIAFATRPLFSSDSRWLAYGLGIARKEREQREQSNQVVHQKLGLLDLHTGTATTIDKVTDYAFSADGAFLAVRGYAASDKQSKGVDLIVRNLSTGVSASFGNVATFAWRDHGAVLAMTVDADARAGNGVTVYDARTGVLRVLESDTAEYVGMIWRKDADDLAVLRVFHDTLYEEPAHRVLAWRNASTPRVTRLELDPATRTGFPAQQRIVDVRELHWAADGSWLFFGMKPWTRKPEKKADEGEQKKSAAAGVEVWHAMDVDIIPEQKMRASLERNRSTLAVWHLGANRLLQLTTDLAEDVSLSDGRYMLVLDGRRYDRERMFGPAYRDLYVVNVLSGERRPVADRIQYQYGMSPGGRYALYVRDGHYWTYDAQTGRTTNITQSVPTTFINVDDDLTTTEKPPFGTGSWTTDDRSVLLHDKYDIWEVRPDGSRATNLTQGRADRVVHRRYWLDPDQRVVDMSQAVYTTLYGERTKRYGYGRVRTGAPAERLVFVDKHVGRLTKAKDADVFLYRMEAFDDSPDYFVGTGQLADARQVTRTNPFQLQYAWGRAELIDYRSARGDELQGALLYPANYEAGRTYPLIVYPYEMTSSTIHTYHVPNETVAYNPTVFTQNGYFVLRPDIRYRARNPGISAVEALVPATEAVLARGVVDRARIGIAGHSWGAYQAAFIITQTALFRTAVAGAPLTDLISMYLSIYWNTGGTDAKIFETGQARMEVPFWEDIDAYIRNSPLFNIQQMNAPLLIAFGDKDGAVDWHQGIELYNAARRAGKPLVMLVYEGENHSLARKANQIDYQRRINEWFAHYLKGEPAPAWITTGVKHVSDGR